MTSTTSRIRGALYGVAVADALGGLVEFQKRGTFAPVTNYRYNGNFDLPPGSWTDDTSMTLCLAQSLVENDGQFVLHDQVSKYFRWYRNGYMSSIGRCFDIGNATRQACNIWDKSFKDPSGRNEKDGRLPGQAEIDSALNREYCCGNGSLMRCTPISLVFHSDLNLALKYAELASIPTHPHPVCIEACQLYTLLIADIISDKSQSKDALFISFRQYRLNSPILVDTFAKCPTLEILAQTPSSEISSSGFVVHTLDSALWAFFSTGTFSDGALKVVNLGDDADTVGAVYGGLAGAYYGLEAIAGQWIRDLEAKSVLDEVIQGIIRLTSK